MELCKTTGLECCHCVPGACEHRQTAMDKDERQEILMAAIDWYGMGSQVDMAIEEMAELTQALCKIKRGWSEEVFANIREEIADVQIMLDQLRLIYGQTAKIETAKLVRLQRRVINAQESRSADEGDDPASQEDSSRSGD